MLRTIVHIQAVAKYFEKMTKDVMEKYAQAGNRVFYATIGPRQGCVTPFDYLFVERTMKSSDVSGIRISLYLKSDEDAHLATNRWLIGAQAPNLLLQSACDEAAEA